MSSVSCVFSDLRLKTSINEIDLKSTDWCTFKLNIENQWTGNYDSKKPIEIRRSIFCLCVDFKAKLDWLRKLTSAHWDQLPEPERIHGRYIVSDSKSTSNHCFTLFAISRNLLVFPSRLIAKRDTTWPASTDRQGRHCVSHWALRASHSMMTFYPEASVPCQHIWLTPSPPSKWNKTKRIVSKTTFLIFLLLSSRKKLFFRNWCNQHVFERLGNWAFATFDVLKFDIKPFQR